MFAERCGKVPAAREKAPAGQVLPPSGGPTQIGTTPQLIFRAVVGTDSEMKLAVAL
jgi:hypothetical protein